MDRILLNNEEYHFSEKDLPCLVHYGVGVGGSHFSVTMVADLFLHGSKILFLTGYPMAQDNFLKQVSGPDDKIIIVKEPGQLLEEKQAIIIESSNQALFMQALGRLKDIKNRIIFVKNFDIFNKDIIEAASQYEKVIISGNLDNFPEGDSLLKVKFKTVIQFSKSRFLVTHTYPKVEKYVGFFEQATEQGLISVSR